MARLWIGDAAMEALALPDPGLQREIGIPDVTFHSSGVRGRRLVEGPEAQIQKLVSEAQQRYEMNGGEGFDDGLRCLNSLRSFAKRGAAFFQQ